MQMACLTCLGYDKSHMEPCNNDYSVLVRLSEIVSFAEFLSIKTVAVRNLEPKYPMTIGEKIVCYVLHPLLLHEWSSREAEKICEPLEESLFLLDTGVDRPDAWNDLFVANIALKEYLEKPPKQI